MDITYIPMKKGFMYLAAIIDLHSRYVVHWSLSNCMSAEWCTETLKTAIEKHGVPEIFNTDQGSQFTSDVFINELKNFAMDNEKFKNKLSLIHIQNPENYEKSN